jgi:hypothetical protein
MSMKTRGVAFNLEDPDQKQQYDHTTQFKNFSAYVKRLIQRDMDSRGIKPTNMSRVVIQQSASVTKIVLSD